MILFVGSSSFTRWTDLAKAFPGRRVLNRAFGGSTLLDLTRFERSVIFAYKPAQIVIYCGENDFAVDPKMGPRTVVERFAKLYGDIRWRFPKTPLIYVAMKPSPSRFAMYGKFVQANRTIQRALTQSPYNQYLDPGPQMLGKDGTPNPAIFGPDKLHMNAKGYAIWTRLLKPLLVKTTP